MSGPKQSQVSAVLTDAVKNIESITQSINNITNSKLSNVKKNFYQEINNLKTSLENIQNRINSISNEEKKFIKAEITDIQNRLNTIKKEIGMLEDSNENLINSNSNINKLENNIKNILENAHKEANEIKHIIRNRTDYLNKEMTDAQNLNQRINKEKNIFSQSTLKTSKEIIDLSNSINHRDILMFKKINDMSTELDKLVGIGKQRKEDNDLRTQLRSEIEFEKNKLNTSESNKFFPEENQAIYSEITNVMKLLQQENSGTNEAKNLISKMKTLYENTNITKTEWYEKLNYAKSSVENLQKTMQAYESNTNIKHIDTGNFMSGVEIITKWQDKYKENISLDLIQNQIKNLQDQLNKAQKDNKANFFNSVESQSNTNLNTINDLYNFSIEKEQKWQDREKITDKLLNILGELGFDSPQVSYEAQDQRSDILIKATAENKEIEFKIDDEGNNDMRVEGNCVGIIESIQAKSQNEDIHFNMTNWGTDTNPKKPTPIDQCKKKYIHKHHEYEKFKTEESEITTLKKKISSLKNEISTNEQEISVLTKELNQAKAIITEKEQEISLLNKNISNTLLSEMKKLNQTDSLLTITKPSSIDLPYSELIHIPGGNFMQKTNDNEGKAFSHTISAFSLGKYQVTYELWYEVSKWAKEKGYTIYRVREGSKGKLGAGPTSNKHHPVSWVSWIDAIVWCNAYSEMEGKTPVYTNNSSVITDANTAAFDNIVCDWNANGYRLPTEGEWQFAASDCGQLPWNNVAGDYSDSYNKSSVFGNYAWWDGNACVGVGSKNPDYGTHNVGTKSPNKLGLYDMSGNVWEWNWDLYGYLPTTAQTDYRGHFFGGFRVLRGGSWDYSSYNLQVCCRSSCSPGFKSYRYGLRVACSP